MLLLQFASSRRKCSCLSTPSLYLPSLESVVGGDNKRIGGISIRVKCPELTHFNISLGKYFTNKIYFILKFKGFGGISRLYHQVLLILLLLLFICLFPLVYSIFLLSNFVKHLHYLKNCTSPTYVILVSVLVSQGYLNKVP